MSGDDFRDRYQILKPLAEGDVYTFLARSRDGERVMVHVLRGSDETNRELLDRVEALPEALSARVREVTEHRGTGVVVTEFLDDFESLDAWLPPLEAIREPGHVDEEEDGDDEPGEFTRLFQQAETEDVGEAAGDEPEPEPEAASEPELEAASEPEPEAASAPEPEAASAPEPEDEPGEFTRMFEARGSGETSAPDETPGPAPGTPDEPESERSEPASRPRPESPDPGEPAVRGDERDRGDGDQADADGEDAGPGEFTRMFGSPDEPSEDLPASAGTGRGGGGSAGGARGGSDDYLRRLGRSGPGEGPSAEGPTEPAGAGPEPSSGQEADDAAEPSGPGRYTRMIEQQGAAAADAAGGPTSPGGGGPVGFSGSGAPGGGAASGEGGGGRSGGDDDGSGSRTPYLIGLGVIALLAVALVLALVLLAGGGEDDAEPAVPDSVAGQATSALPRQHHEDLELRVREVRGDVDRDVARPADGGPVLA